MIRFAVRRVATSTVVVWAVVTLTFVVHQALPSDPARALAGPQARPADVERIRSQLQLDRPLWSQYSAYLGRIVHLGTNSAAHKSCVSVAGPFHLDLGVSYYRQGQSVLHILRQRTAPTLLLCIAAVGVQLLLGLACGTIAALRRGRIVDHATVGLTLLGVSAPTFITGLLLQYWCSYRWRVLPIDGYGATAAEHLRGLVLPALTLGLAGASYYARFTRDEMIVTLQQDYVRAARARGLGRTRVVVRHALRNALMPLVTILGMDIGTLMGGAVVTETLFRWPGVGALTVESVLAHDTPVVMGVVLLSSVCVVVANLGVDVVYFALDPRLRRPARAR